MFYSVKQILPSILNIKQDWRLYLLKNWQVIVGTLSAHMRLEKIQDNLLVIGVYEPQWMQELFFLSNVLLHSVNKTLGQEYIKTLKFKLVEKYKPKVEKKNNQKNNITLKTVNLNYNQKMALSKIQDEQLRKILTGFLARCLTNYES